jgi:DNA-binding NarL/FixJ family response regulator
VTLAASGPGRVFCAANQPVFRDALRDLVAATPGLVHVGEASEGSEAIAAIWSLHPDLVLMDMRLRDRDGDGFEVARILAESRRDLVVVLMSVDPIDSPLRLAAHGGEVRMVVKHELCPRILLDLWHSRPTR